MASGKMNKNNKSIETNEQNIEAKKLSDEKLSDTTGGGFDEWWASDWSYESGDKPKWELNRKVMVKIKDTINYGIIIAVSDTKDGGLINKEFTYTLYFSNDVTRTGIYESAIRGYCF